MQIEKHDKIIIAVDGYSSTGKSTLARDIARHFRIKYIDSGAMYRAVTLFALRAGLYDPASQRLDEDQMQKALENLHVDFFLDESTAEQYIMMNGENVEEEIRRMEVSQNVSMISRYGFIRKQMVEKQRAFARDDSLVMDGRDIGTVVFPRAQVKIFMTASLDVRAQRRYQELRDKGLEVDYEEVNRNVKERDRIDENRTESPLRKAPDAAVIDNSHISRQKQLQLALRIIRERLDELPER